MRVFLTDALPNQINIMLDLETWGTTPGSAIRSVGACTFDPFSSEIGEKFYSTVDDGSCFEAGLTVDAGTKAWWAKQKKEVQDALLIDQKPLAAVVRAFNDWFRKERGVFVWSQGANFDQPVFEAAARAVGQECPWKFWDSRCTRTAYDVCKFNPFAMKRQGSHHNALDDAIHQARCVQAAYARLR